MIKLDTNNIIDTYVMPVKHLFIYKNSSGDTISVQDLNDNKSFTVGSIMINLGSQIILPNGINVAFNSLNLDRNFNLIMFCLNFSANNNVNSQIVIDELNKRLPEKNYLVKELYNDRGFGILMFMYYPNIQ